MLVLCAHIREKGRGNTMARLESRQGDIRARAGEKLVIVAGQVITE